MSQPAIQDKPATKFPQVPWLEPQFFENQRQFPMEELRKYAGKFVAFSWEGDRIVASGEDEADVRRRLVEAGLDPQKVVFSFVE